MNVTQAERLRQAGTLWLCAVISRLFCLVALVIGSCPCFSSAFAQVLREGGTIGDHMFGSNVPAHRAAWT
jgi:hypothetical protein